MGHDADKRLDRAHLAAIADADARAAHAQPRRPLFVLALVVLLLLSAAVYWLPHLIASLF